MINIPFLDFAAYLPGQKYLMQDSFVTIFYFSAMLDNEEVNKYLSPECNAADLSLL